MGRFPNHKSFRTATADERMLAVMLAATLLFAVLGLIGVRAADGAHPKRSAAPPAVTGSAGSPDHRGPAAGSTGPSPPPPAPPSAPPAVGPTSTSAPAAARVPYTVTRATRRATNPARRLTQVARTPSPAPASGPVPAVDTTVTTAPPSPAAPTAARPQLCVFEGAVCLPLPPPVAAALDAVGGLHGAP